MRIRRLRAFAVAVAVMTSSCGGDGPTPSPVPSPDSVPPTPVPTTVVVTVPTAAPTPTPIAPLSVGELPRVELSDVQATAVCDPEPGQADEDAGESTVYCSDGLALAVAVVRTATPDQVVRLYLRRPDCASLPCTEDELSTADVTVWTTSNVFSVHLDSRLETVGQASAGASDHWPEAGGAPAPEVARPTIAGAPQDVAAREPYPFCGRAEIGDPPEVQACFRDAVLDGRPAEMIDRVYGIEGGEILWIQRYDGQGRLVRLEHDRSVDNDGRTNDTWRRYEGAMILGINRFAWHLDPWYGTEQQY